MTMLLRSAAVKDSAKQRSETGNLHAEQGQIGEESSSSTRHDSRVDRKDLVSNDKTREMVIVPPFPKTEFLT